MRTADMSAVKKLFHTCMCGCALASQKKRKVRWHVLDLCGISDDSKKAACLFMSAWIVWSQNYDWTPTWSDSFLLRHHQSHDLWRGMLFGSTRIGLGSRWWVYKPLLWTRVLLFRLSTRHPSSRKDETNRFMSFSGFSSTKHEPVVVCLLLWPRLSKL
jgi:hypothetical protein